MHAHVTQAGMHASNIMHNIVLWYIILYIRLYMYMKLCRSQAVSITNILLLFLSFFIYSFSFIWKKYLYSYYWMKVFMFVHFFTGILFKLSMVCMTHNQIFINYYFTIKTSSVCRLFPTFEHISLNTDIKFKISNT